MKTGENRTAATFFFDLVSEFLPHQDADVPEESGPISDRSFYGTMTLVAAALMVMGIVFRTFA